MIVPPLRTTLLVTPDNDRNPPKRLQELGKVLFDQSSKNQKISTSLDEMMMKHICGQNLDFKSIKVNVDYTTQQATKCR
jgi:hypothetical protein